MISRSAFKAWAVALLVCCSCAGNRGDADDDVAGVDATEAAPAPAFEPAMVTDQTATSPSTDDPMVGPSALDPAVVDVPPTLPTLAGGATEVSGRPQPSEPARTDATSEAAMAGRGGAPPLGDGPGTSPEAVDVTTTSTTPIVAGASAVDGGAPATGGFGSAGAPSNAADDAVPIYQGPSFADVGNFIQVNCASDACHGGPRRPTLTNDESLETTLLETRVQRCGDAPLVTPGEPNRSAFFMLMNGDCNGLVMPAGCGVPCFEQNVMDAFKTWLSRSDPFE